MFHVFSYSNILGKEDKPFAKIPCEIRMYVKYKNSNANCQKGGKWTMYGQGGKYFLSIATKVFILDSVTKGQGRLL